MALTTPRAGSTDDRTPVADRRVRPGSNACTGSSARAYAGIGIGISVLQFDFGADCMVALMVGLLGGMLAGMALTQFHEPDDPEPLAAAQTHAASMAPIETTPPDEALEDPALTDEERIVRLLASNNGRMKQTRIVEETGWSKAKVSRLLSAMAEDGEITKLTVGRENIIFLGSPDGVYTPSDGPPG
ncbi:helix-turn-helix transcriptional regulator [Halalkalicoccus tibetensis]|uniref:Helix-turn-helix transcriptional regulator n=1 Tax=Halalkalicoccus tibetensis TaxID=175632 RepID=A0ABD5V8S4_9EURY